MNVPKYLKMMIIEEAKQEIAVLRSPNKMLLFKSGELNEVLTKKKEEQTFVYIFKSVTGKLKCVLLNAVNKGPIFTVSAFSEFPFLTFFTKFPLKLKQFKSWAMLDIPSSLQFFCVLLLKHWSPPTLKAPS